MQWFGRCKHCGMVNKIKIINTSIMLHIYLTPFWGGTCIYGKNA